MLNPDGRLWIDRLSGGLVGYRRTPVAPPMASASFGWSRTMSAPRFMPVAPRVSAELPETGERFEGLLPPVVAAPAFAIRKPAVAVFTLDDYVAAGIMTSEQAEALRAAVADAQEHPGRRRHLDRQDHADQRAAGRGRQDRRSRRADRGYARAAVHGAEPRGAAHQGRRGLAVRSRPLVAAPAARPHPDRRGARRRGARSAKAWGTGHPGGIGTIHAGTALGALRRLEQLIQEAVVTVPRALIAETIDLIAVLVRPRRRPPPRRTRRASPGSDPTGDYSLSPAGDQP